MKFKKIILIITAVITLISCTVFTGCNTRLKSYVQELNYTESTEKINNPDQGFYRPIYVRMTENGVTYNKNIVTANTQLYHLRIDISAFSKAVNNDSDKLIPQTALDGLNEILAYLKEKDKNAIVRFAYDPSYGGSKDKEPDFEVLLKHIQQVCPILNGYVNTVTAIEAGLIGPWGEMHSSAIANAEHTTPIIETFLSNTKNIPVLVRTPKMIYSYLGITINDIDGYTIPASHKAYRLGLYNDGYLGSDSDLGTYSDREREIEFLSRQTDRLPYGGEVVIPGSTLHNIDVCLPEMFKINLSYLNTEWNNQVIDKWKNSTYTQDCGADSIYYGKTAFNYIENHMGYRFVLTNSVLSYSDKFNKLKVELKLKSVGFGNLNRTKRAKLILVDENGEIKFTKNVENFIGNDTFNCSVKLKADKSNYGVYLCIYGEEVQNTPLYCLQFANDGLWNAELKANKIGSIKFN